MKTKKIFICFLFMILPITIMVGVHDAKAQEIVVTCSGGSCGQCFEMLTDKTNPYDPHVYCHWTGKMADKCSCWGIIIDSLL